MGAVAASAAAGEAGGYDESGAGLGGRSSQTQRGAGLRHLIPCLRG